MAVGRSSDHYACKRLSLETCDEQTLLGTQVFRVVHGHEGYEKEHLPREQADYLQPLGIILSSVLVDRIQIKV